MNKRKTILVALSVCASAAVTGVLFSKNKPNSFLAGDESVEWRHYTAVDPTVDEYGAKEYWTNCNGTTTLEKPVLGTFTESGPADVAHIKSVSMTDERLVAPSPIYALTTPSCWNSGARKGNSLNASSTWSLNFKGESLGVLKENSIRYVAFDLLGETTKSGSNVFDVSIQKGAEYNTMLSFEAGESHRVVLDLENYSEEDATAFSIYGRTFRDQSGSTFLLNTGASITISNPAVATKDDYDSFVEGSMVDLEAESYALTDYEKMFNYYLSPIYFVSYEDGAPAFRATTSKIELVRKPFIEQLKAAGAASFTFKLTNLPSEVTSVVFRSVTGDSALSGYSFSATNNEASITVDQALINTGEAVYIRFKGASNANIPVTSAKIVGAKVTMPSPKMKDIDDFTITCNNKTTYKYTTNSLDYAGSSLEFDVTAEMPASGNNFKVYIGNYCLYVADKSVRFCTVGRGYGYGDVSGNANTITISSGTFALTEYANTVHMVLSFVENETDTTAKLVATLNSGTTLTFTGSLHKADDESIKTQNPYNRYEGSAIKGYFSYASGASTLDISNVYVCK